MHITRILLGVISGALTSGVILSSTFYYWSLNYSTGSGNFIGFRNPEIILLIVGALFGSVIGGVSGAVIVGFSMSFLKSVLFGVLFNLFLSAAILLWTGGGERDFFYLFCLLILAGIINGAVVSLISNSEKSPV